MIAAIHDKRSDIAAACRRHGVVRLAVFGSAARGSDFSPGHSDADLLADFGPWTGRDSFDAFRKDVEAILDRPVDLLDWSALTASRNDIRRANILADAVTILES